MFRRASEVSQLGRGCRQCSVRRRESNLDDLIGAVMWDQLLHPEDVAGQACFTFFLFLQRTHVYGGYAVLLSTWFYKWVK